MNRRNFFTLLITSTVSSTIAAKIISKLKEEKLYVNMLRRSTDTYKIRQYPLTPDEVYRGGKIITPDAVLKQWNKMCADYWIELNKKK